MRIWEKIKKHKRFWEYSLAFVFLAVVLIVSFLRMLSHGAAYIFNKEMEKQTLLRGTITVETITAHINGSVYFENLEWRDPTGEPIMIVPSGSFKVRVWDVAMKNIKSTTLQELVLNNATFAVRLNEKMQVDFLRQSEALKEQKKLEEGWENKVNLRDKSHEERRRIGKEKRDNQRAKIEREWHNISAKGKHLKLRIDFNDCRMELFAKGQHYVLSRVNIDVDLDTEKSVYIDVDTGTFGGTMVGSGMDIEGGIDFREKPVPVCDINVRFNEVKPSSLGFGMNVNDRMSLNTYFEGPVNRPDSYGSVYMKELHIPGFDFYDVDGLIHLEEGKLIFDNVDADVFGGKIIADGEYDFDTRGYIIRGKGTGLQASQGLKKSGLSCLVDLDILVEGDENPRKTVISGEFTSGKGTYRIIPFKRLSGRFKSEYKDLKFWDARIEFYGLTVTTPSIRILNGKLTMDPIDIFDENGVHKNTFDPKKGEYS